MDAAVEKAAAPTSAAPTSAAMSPLCIVPVIRCMPTNLHGTWQGSLFSFEGKYGTNLTRDKKSRTMPAFFALSLKTLFSGRCRLIGWGLGFAVFGIGCGII